MRASMKIPNRTGSTYGRTKAKVEELMKERKATMNVLAAAVVDSRSTRPEQSATQNRLSNHNAGSSQNKKSGIAISAAPLCTKDSSMNV